MIVGPIDSYRKYQHVETQLPIEVVKTDVQLKVTNDFGGPQRWTTGVIYAREGSSDWFVVDVDSFRRKFKEDEEVAA